MLREISKKLDESLEKLEDNIEEEVYISQVVPSRIFNLASSEKTQKN